MSKISKNYSDPQDLCQLSVNSRKIFRYSKFTLQTPLYSKKEKANVVFSLPVHPCEHNPFVGPRILFHVQLLLTGGGSGIFIHFYSLPTYKIIQFIFTGSYIICLLRRVRDIIHTFQYEKADETVLRV